MSDNEYRAFNYYIYDAFLRPNLQSYGNLASVLADVSRIRSHECFSRACEFLGATPWLELCDYGEVPSYLGLVAVQVLAGAGREGGEVCSARTYNPRLAGHLGVDGGRLYRNYREAQQTVYGLFETWCREKDFGILLTKDQAHYRYVQYPLSLALLDRDELSSLRAFFHLRGLPPGDEVSFQEFWDGLGTDRLPSPVRRLLRDRLRREPVRRQVYSCYMRWDGTYEDISGATRRSPDSGPGHPEHTLFWPRDHAEPPEFLADGRPGGGFPFQRGGFYVHFPEDGENDWIHVADEFLDYSARWRYLYACVREDSLARFLESRFGADLERFSYEGVQVLLFRRSECIKAVLEEDPRRFPALFQPRLAGGIRLFGRRWMTGGGAPLLLLPDRTGPDAAIGGTLFDANGRPVRRIPRLSPRCLARCPAGRYALFHHPDRPPVRFEIAAPGRRVQETLGGWTLTRDRGERIAGAGQARIHGLDFSRMFSPAPASPAAKRRTAAAVSRTDSCRLWMDLAAGAGSMARPFRGVGRGGGVVHDSLRRCSDGIRDRRG